jgi:ferric-dicitrate binding protein FerR (iron transport regulator)
VDRRVGANSAQELRFSLTMANSVQYRPKLEEAEQLVRMLELELAQKRANWAQASQRNRSRRSAAFLFLFLVVAACLAGFFFAFVRVSDQRQNHPTTAATDR